MLKKRLSSWNYTKVDLKVQCRQVNTQLNVMISGSSHYYFSWFANKDFVCQQHRPTAHDFQIRRRWFDYGCRPTAYDTYRETFAGGWRMKSARSISSHLLLFVQLKFVDLKILS